MGLDLFSCGKQVLSSIEEYSFPVMENIPDPISANSEAAALYLSRYVLPLGLKSNSAGLPWDPMNRANFTLVDAGKRDVFLTCHHVVEHFDQLHGGGEDPEIVAYAQNITPLVELNGFTPVDRNKTPMDIAVYSGLEDRISIPGSYFYPLKQKVESPQVQEGDPIMIVGYPAANVGVSTSHAEFGIMQFLAPASSVSEQRIVLSDESGEQVFRDISDTPRAASEMDLGGLSGSPAFHLAQDGCYTLVGIVTDGTIPGNPLLISRIDCILPNGMLDHHRI